MKKTIKKLSLRAETIRALDRVALSEPAGGLSTRCNRTFTCASGCAPSECFDCTPLTQTK